MDKPKCRVCEHKHWSSEPHVFAKEKERDPSPRGTEVPPDKDVGASTQVERNRKWRAANKERYNAYQRKLMRKRRE